MELRVLLLDARPDDAVLVEQALRRGGCAVEMTHAASRARFIGALASGTFDAVIAADALSDITAREALQIVRDRRPLPFILVADTATGRQALEAVKAGAHDCIVRDELDRLAPALARALEHAGLERERAHAHDEIRRERDELRHAHAIARLGGWEWDAGRDQVRWSDEVAAVFRLGARPRPRSRAELLALLPPADRERLDAAITRAVETLAPFTLEHDLVAGDGKLRVLQSVTVVAAADSVRLCATAQDVTEQRRAEQQNARIERADSLGRLASAVAHEFNNVLMGIQPFAEIAERTADDPQSVRSAARIIQQSVMRGRRIAHEILRYTAPAAPVLGPLPIGQWLAELEPELLQQTGSGMRLRLDIARSLRLRGDRAQLSQVMVNLVANAREAGGAGGEIAIAAQPAGGGEELSFGKVPAGEFVHITVRDNGCGMTPEVLEKAFEPLFTTKKSGGTGLGLAVVHQIVAAHEGYVFAESAVGRGTTIHILLPRAASDAAADATATPADRWRPARIVLVEDEESISAGLQMLLSIDGIDVQIARRGNDAEDAVAATAPDAVVLDIGLPDIDGIEVFSRLRRRWPCLPIVFSTGHGEAANLHGYLSQPNVGHLLKPYDLDALYEQFARAAPSGASMS